MNRFNSFALVRTLTAASCRLILHARSVAAVGLTLIIASTAFCAAPSTDEQIVASFFPSSLLNDRGRRGHDLDTKEYNFVRADLDGTGSLDYIVVAYYNGLHDEVSVIRATTTAAPAVAADLGLSYIGGALATIEVIDLDGDHKPEIHLSIPLGAGTQDWLLKWSAGALKLFGPTEKDPDGRVFTQLSGLRLVDIDGDGVPELLVPNGLAGLREYRYTGTGYVTAPPVVVTYHIVRTTGDPDALDTGIVVERAGAYVLTIVNGDRDGNHRSTAAYVAVNGEAIFPEGAFKKADRTLTARVSLKETNELYVELSGAPGSELTVTITRAGE
jgi:hypothetical protein